MQSVQYFDGLGRLEQTVQTKGSADGRNDIVVPIAYDELGREVKNICLMLVLAIKVVIKPMV